MATPGQPEAPATSAISTVFIVDDDEESRRSIELLLRSMGYATQAHASAVDFLADFDASAPGCLVLDVRMPGLSGLDLQRKLKEANAELPIIFVSAFAEVSMAVEAMRSGALDFLEKPYSPQELLDRVSDALTRDAASRAAARKRREFELRVERLSPRLRQVLVRLAQGRTPKEIAYALGISLPTVYFHRRRLMEQMNMDSSVELSAVVAELELA